MSLQDSDFLCEGWLWDPVLRELRKHRHKRKGWEEEPEAVERLQPVTSVTWHRWSQAPVQTSTGQITPSSFSRIVAAYEVGGNVTLNEFDRACAEKLAHAIAKTYGLSVVQEGAPGGRRGGNLPERDQMGRLVLRGTGIDVTLDEVSGELTVVKPKRPFGKSRRTVSTTEIRRLELNYDVKGPVETFTIRAIVGVEEDGVPVASHSGYEGWADPEEWREFLRELGRSLGVEVSL